MRNGILFVVALVGALVLAVIGTTPPSPRNSGTDPAEFSAGRAMVDVREIARSPHPTGSAENARVRAYLAQRLSELGFTATEQRAPLEERPARRLAGWSGDTGPAPELVNVIGYKAGTDPSLPAVALMAHHDTVWGSPGAADDTAGIAAILETARALQARGPLRRDLYLVLTDAEELGLAGARAFFARHPEAGRVGAIVNLEARGGGGVATLFELSQGDAAAARLYAAAVPRPATSSLAAYLYSVLPNDTDLSVPLEQGGVAAYNIAFIGRSGLYHSPLATPDRLDQGALQHMGDQTLGLASALGNAQVLPQPTANAVFFDLFGLVALVYAPGWGWAMLVLAVAGLGAAFLRGERTGGVIGGAGRMVVLLAATGAVLFGLNWLSGAGGDYYDRLAAIPLLTGMAAAACLALFLALFGSAPAANRTRIGASLPLLVLALGGQALAPTASYFLVIPVMLAGVLEGLRALASGTAARAVDLANAAVAAVATGYLLTLSFWAMQGVGPTMPWVLAAPLALAVLLFLPLWPGVARSRSVALAGFALALVLALWVRFDPVAPTVAAYATDKPG